MRKVLVALTFLVAAFATVPAHADAELEKGKPAPEWRGKQYLNSKPFKLKSLRGKVVVVQLVHTSSKPCKEQVPVLAKMLEEHGKKGLAVVWLLEEDRKAAEGIVEETKAKFPVVAGCREVRQRYPLVKGYPTTYVVDVDGNVAWKGNFADRALIDIGLLLLKVSDLPWLPKEYAELRKKLIGKNYVAAGKIVKEALAREDLDEKVKTGLEEYRARIEKAGKKALAGPRKTHAIGHYWEAYHQYAEVARLHEGLPAGEMAKKSMELLMEDRKTKREIQAGDFLEELYPEAQRLETEAPKKAAKVLKRVVTKYPRTRAAERAQELVDKLLM